MRTTGLIIKSVFLWIIVPLAVLAAFYFAVDMRYINPSREVGILLLASIMYGLPLIPIVGGLVVYFIVRRHIRKTEAVVGQSTSSRLTRWVLFGIVLVCLILGTAVGNELWSPVMR